MTERRDCFAAGPAGADTRSAPELDAPTASQLGMQLDAQSTSKQDTHIAPELDAQLNTQSASEPDAQLDTHITPDLNVQMDTWSTPPLDVQPDMQQDPSSTGPMSLDAINAALAMNQHYYAEAQAQEAAVRKKSRRLGRWIGVAAVLAAVAVVGLLCYLQLLVDTVNQVDDDRVMADIMADEAFAQGSASDAFVEPAAYTVDSVEITDRQTNGQDVVVKADVQMSNAYFSESRKVTMTYVNDGDEWQGECSVDSHSVTPLRGILADEEYGIWEADTAYDAETQTCTASRWVEGSADDTWFLTTQGTEIVSYAFADDTWSRAGVDDSQLVRSFQTLAGSYGTASGQSSFWTAASGAGQLQDFQVTWVDDATGTFGGTFAWTSGTSRRLSASQETGEFAGWIDQEGNVGAESDGTAGTMEFTGRANSDGGLELDYVVYYKGVERVFGSDAVSQASGTATLYQGVASEQGSEATYEGNVSFGNFDTSTHSQGLQMSSSSAGLKRTALAAVPAAG